MEYTIRRMHGTPALPLARNLEFFPDGLAAPWSALEEAEIGVYPWDETGYRPQSRARLGWTPEGLYVLMYSREKEIRAEETRIGGGVYNDSCLELYIGELNNPIYFNFECNPIGAMFIGIGADRQNREVLQAYPEGMRVATGMHRGGWWAVSYFVPAAFLKLRGNLTLVEGEELRGNFYKCGDKTAALHHGMWNAVEWPMPDFHRPEYFGKIRVGA